MQVHFKRTKSVLLTWLPAVMPTLLLLIFLSLSAHVLLGLGHWPKPCVEDYQSQAYTIHQQVFTWIAVFTIWVAPLLWFFSLCFRSLRIAWQVHLLQAGVYAAGWGLLGLYWLWDPFRFFSWYLD